VPKVATETPAPGRRERRRAETNRRLLEAARDLFAEQGVDNTRINEITDRADVGFGSFYNYFADKDAIVEGVLSAMTEEHGAAVDQLTAGVEDPAEVMAIAHRHFVRLAVTDPTWGRLVLRLDVTHHVLARSLGHRAARDIQAGVDAGRFRVTDPALALNAMGGALLGTMQAVLEGGVDPDGADRNHAAMILRMLGVSYADAERVASRPLPGGD
jgi:AcrR family transcriptional regulator